jgi:hypothetical protein
MVLKRRVQVRHGRMARVPRLGEQAEVSQAIYPDSATAGKKQPPLHAFAMAGMTAEQCEQRQEYGTAHQEEG